MIEAVADGSSGEIFLQDPFHRSSSVCVSLGVPWIYHVVKLAVSSLVWGLILRDTKLHVHSSLRRRRLYAVCPVPLTSSVISFIITHVLWLRAHSFTVGFPSDHHHSQLRPSHHLRCPQSISQWILHQRQYLDILIQRLRKPNPLTRGKVKGLVIPIFFFKLIFIET